MSETPKAKATKKPAAKKAVIADSTNNNKPVKKAPVKKAPAKKKSVVEQVVEVEKAIVAEVQANPELAKAVVETIKPGLWNRIKGFFGIK